MSTVKTVGGRPVTGEVSSRRHKAEQKPIEDFIAALDKLFEFPEVGAVRWSQYTPSFNDGDPCVFTTGQFEVKLTGADGDGGEAEDGYLEECGIDDHFSTYENEYTWRDKKHHPIAKALEEHFGYRVNKAYEDALENAFGDPAQVVATREGFHVEGYDCGY